MGFTYQHIFNGFLFQKKEPVLFDWKALFSSKEKPGDVLQEDFKGEAFTKAIPLTTSEQNFKTTSTILTNFQISPPITSIYTCKSSGNDTKRDSFKNTAAASKIMDSKNLDSTIPIKAYSKEFAFLSKIEKKRNLNEYSEILEEENAKIEDRWKLKRKINLELLKKFDLLKKQDPDLIHFIWDQVDKKLGFEAPKEEKNKLFHEWVYKYLKKSRELLEVCAANSSVNVCLDCSNRFELSPKDSCNKRFCSVCARRFSKKWFWQYCPKILKYMEQNKNLVPVHIVLTRESTSDFLGNQFSELQKDFLTLRRRKFWKDHFTAAISSLESTWNEKTGLPHPHVHILAFRKSWVSQRELSEEWESITGSQVVWISKTFQKPSLEAKTLNGKESVIDAILEASKYVVKSADLVKLKPHYFFEFLLGIRGKNLKDVLGGLRGYDITEEEELKFKAEIRKIKGIIEKEKGICDHCGSTNFVKLLVKLDHLCQKIIIEDFKTRST